MADGDHRCRSCGHVWVEHEEIKVCPNCSSSDIGKEYGEPLETYVNKSDWSLLKTVVGGDKNG